MSEKYKKIAKILPLFGILFFIAGNIIGVIQGRYNIASGILIILGALSFLALFLRMEMKNIGLYINLLLFWFFILSGFALLYMIAGNHRLSWDLTKIRAYSLSPQTIQYLKSLDKDIEIIAFTNDYLPFEEFLSQYKRYSGHIKIEIYNPLKDILTARSWAKEINGEIADGDIIIKAGNRTKKIRTLIEEALTNAIVEAQRDKQIKAYLTAGHGERPKESRQSRNSQIKQSNDKTDVSISLLVGKLEEKGVIMEELDLAKKGFVPEDCSLIICAGPIADFFPTETAAIKSYLDKGGRAIFMLDPAESGEEAFPNIKNLLDEYGIVLKDDIIIDPNPVSYGMYQDPLSPLISEYEKSHKISSPLSELTSVNFIVPRARTVSFKEGLPPSYSASSLFYSSNVSWSEDIKTILQTRKISKPEDESRIKKQSMAVAVSKEIGSESGSAQAKIVVFGDSDIFTNDMIIKQIPAIIFYNAFHWLTEQEDLIAIPPKSFEETPINLSESKYIWLYLTLVVIFPGFIFFGGLGYTLYRRRNG